MCFTGNSGGEVKILSCPKSLKGCLFFQCFVRRQSQAFFSTEEQLLIKKHNSYWKIALSFFFKFFVGKAAIYN